MNPLRVNRRRRRDGNRGDQGEASEGDQQPHQRRTPTARRRPSSFQRSLGVVLGLLLADRGVTQLFDGGEIALDCGSCECTGTSDDGSIVAFDNPSSGDRIASVNGGYSEILTTSCGASVMVVGSTIYELSGVGGLESRDMDVLAMAPSECVTADTPADADCYEGPTSTLALDDGISVEVTFNFATWVDGATKYKYNMRTLVSGASVVDTSAFLCFDNGFVAVLFDIAVLGNTYKYNYEFDYPGSSSSSDLSVDAVPSADADAVACGTVPAPTPAPLPLLTPSPTAAASPPTNAPFVAPTRKPLTPAPVSLPPAVATTTAPVGTNATVASPAPADIVTASSAPVAVVAGNSSTGSPTLGGGGPLTIAPVMMTPVDGGDEACLLPEASPCTLQTLVAKTNDGIGDYYDPACDVPEGRAQPEGCYASSLCRRCFFDTPLYLRNNNGTQPPNYPNCPCCVLSLYWVEGAANLDGCDASPAPTPQPVGGNRGVDAQSLGFEDPGWQMNAGEAAAIASLGLLAVLTFFPT